MLQVFMNMFMKIWLIPTNRGDNQIFFYIVGTTDKVTYGDMMADYVSMIAHKSVHDSR